MSDGVTLRKEAESAIVELSEMLQGVKIETGECAVKLDDLKSVHVHYEIIHDAISPLADKLIKLAGNNKLCFADIEFSKLPGISQQRIRYKGISFMLISMGMYIDPEKGIREVKRMEVMFAVTPGNAPQAAAGDDRY